MNLTVILPSLLFPFRARTQVAGPEGVRPAKRVPDRAFSKRPERKFTRRYSAPGAAYFTSSYADQQYSADNASDYFKSSHDPLNVACDSLVGQAE
jgi:hypothetical protein